MSTKSSLDGTPCPDGCESDEPCGGTLRTVEGQPLDIARCDGPCQGLYVEDDACSMSPEEPCATWSIFNSQAGPHGKGCKCQ